MATRGVFRLTISEPNELEIHLACVNALDKILLPPVQFTTFESGHFKLSPAQAARQTRLKVATGWPDILLVWRGIWGIEIKSSGGTLSKTVVRYDRRGRPRIVIGQEDRFQLLRAAGFRDIAVVTSITDLIRVLATWNIPRREVL